jgi:hypothetical protein
MRREEADQRMSNFRADPLVLQKRMPAETGVLQEAVAWGHLVHPVAKEAACIAHLLVEAVATGEGVDIRPKDERVTAPDTHVLVMAVPFGKSDVCVMAQEARQRMPDPRQCAVFSKIVSTAAAYPVLGSGGPKHTVVHGVAPQPTAHALNRAENVGSHAI